MREKTTLPEIHNAISIRIEYAKCVLDEERIGNTKVIQLFSKLVYLLAISRKC
jgi:hypothetical protein